jgi:hypothetical protein
MLKDVEVVDIENSGTAEENIHMLGTIRLPKNLRLLSERLPKSNYGGPHSAKKKKAEDKIENGPKGSLEVPNPSTSELLAKAIPPRS